MATKKKMKREVEEEPTSPSTRLMQTPKFNLCIISVKGYTTAINAAIYKAGVEQTVLNHPRFTSILVTDNGKTWWKQATVDIENHVFEVDLDPDMECPDEFVQEYASTLSRIPMDPSKPLWEIHILNVKTSDANATVFMKIHHSMGDGVSLMYLLHACSRRISDPDSLPSFPAALSKSSDGVGFLATIWKVLMVCFYTFIDCMLLVATILFLKDTPTPLTIGRVGAEPARTRFVHRIVSLDDVRLIKTALNMTINDVLLGVTEAGLSRYLRSRYEKVKDSLPRRVSVRSAVMFNLRQTPTIEELVEIMETKELNGVWGNMVGIALLPFTIDAQEDPLAYIHRAKSTMDRKKLSLAHNFTFFAMKLVMQLFGTQAAGRMTRVLFRNTTFTFSNVMGPSEEVYLFGHRLSYIAPSVHGIPQSLVVHYQSYGGKLIISIGADEKVVHNPNQLCDDLVLSLQNIKNAVIKKDAR